MARSDIDVSSLESNDVDSEHQQQAADHEAPIQYHTSNNSQQSRRSSITRRISTAANSFFTIPSQGMFIEEDARQRQNCDDDEFVIEELFGARQLTHSLTRPTSRTSVADDVASYLSQDSMTAFPQTYEGEEAAQTWTTNMPEIERRRSTVVTVIQAVTRKFNFWDKDFHAHRIQIAVTFANNYIYLIIGFSIALCIYWGSYFDRAAKYKNLKFAVMIADKQVGQLPPILGETVEGFFQNVPILLQLGNYDFWDYTRLETLASSHNNTITQEVYRQIHHQKYWGAFYVHENATLQWFELLSTLSPNFDPSTSLMEVVYETGRDFNAMANSITTIIQEIVRVYYAFIPQSSLASNMLQTQNSTQQLTILSQAPQLIATIPTFAITDLIPVTNTVFQAPLQIGLIYLVIFSFFQFIFSIKIHMYIASKIKGFQYVVYRMISSQVAYLVLSLAYVTLNRAFGLPFNVTFGQAGFLVIWMFAYLTMGSLGSIIELMVLFLVAIKPQLIGFVLLFVAVTNVAPTVSPIILCPDFYRYGYAMPVRNSYDLMQVAYFNAWKGHMGRNIGILVAWIVVSNAAMPFVMKWMAKKKAKMDAEAAAKQAAEATAQARANQKIN